MRKIVLLLIATSAFVNSYSQQAYFVTGSNFTKYIFTSNQEPMSTSLESGTGTSYEIGYTHSVINDRFSHSIGLNLNEYNALAGSFAASYKWNTKYLGINNSFGYDVPLATYLKLFVNAGLNLSTIIYGKQEINGVVYDLQKQPEFSGLIFMPNAGVQLKYELYELGYLSLGYGYSRGISLFSKSPEKLTTSTNQILFGIHFNIINK